MTLLIIFLFLCLNVHAVVAIETELYIKDGKFMDIMCPAASLNFGVHKTSSKCASMCSKSTACKGFFFSKQTKVCKGTEEVLSDTSGCYNSVDTAYYRTTEVITSTSTTTPTSSSTSSASLYTSASAVTKNQFGNACVLENDCTMSNSICLDGFCSCALGYRFKSSSGLCSSVCEEYGNTYIGYTGYAFSNSDTSDIMTDMSLSECESSCSNSASLCLGFNYSPPYSACKLNIESSTDSYEIFEHPDIKYFSRNCA